MAVGDTSLMYDYGRQAFAQGLVTWKASAGSTIKSMLHDATDVDPNSVYSTANAMDDLTAARVGSDFTHTLVDAYSTGACDADDAVFTAVTGDQVEGVTLYKFITNDAGSTPLVYITFTAVTPNGGNITITWQGTSPYIFRL
jgi:hypothetical protein